MLIHYTNMRRSTHTAIRRKVQAKLNNAHAFFCRRLIRMCPSIGILRIQAVHAVPGFFHQVRNECTCISDGHIVGALLKKLPQNVVALLVAALALFGSDSDEYGYGGGGGPDDCAVM